MTSTVTTGSPVAAAGGHDDRLARTGSTDGLALLLLPGLLATTLGGTTLRRGVRSS